MKFFTKKGFWNKLIVVLLVLIIFSAIIPTHASYAASELGGKLLKPIVDFLLAVADALVDFVQNALYGTQIATIKIDLDDTALQIIAVALAFIVAFIVLIVAAWAIVGAAGAIIAALGITATAGISTVGLGAIAAGGATVAALVFNSNMFRTRNGFTDVFNFARGNF